MQVEARHPHDPTSFTQGLTFTADGRLFESRGLYGQSSVAELSSTDGSVIAERDLDPTLFGEGLAPIRLFGSVLVGISAYLIARLLPAVAGRDDATTRRLGGLAGLAYVLFCFVHGGLSTNTELMRRARAGQTDPRARARRPAKPRL